MVNGGNISYAILNEHRVGDTIATKISTGLASRHTQLTRLYLFGIKSSWINVSKIYEVNYVWLIIYDNSTESSDIWILRYTENKNIQLASHFGP